MMENPQGWWLIITVWHEDFQLAGFLFGSPPLNTESELRGRVALMVADLKGGSLWCCSEGKGGSHAPMRSLPSVFLGQQLQLSAEDETNLEEETATSAPKFGLRRSSWRTKGFTDHQWSLSLLGRMRAKQVTGRHFNSSQWGLIKWYRFCDSFHFSQTEFENFLT